MRRTKLHATLGPASSDAAVLRELVAAGIDGCRINFSHAQPEAAAKLVRLVRTVSQEAGRPVAIREDLQGPRIRVGRLPDGHLPLATGTRVRLVPEGVQRQGEVPIDWPLFVRVVPAGTTILLDEGLLEVRVEGVEDDALVCEVTHGGTLLERKGINVPGIHLPLPALSDKDRADLEIGVALGVDFVSLSFVQTAADILEARQLLGTLGGERVKIVAKIEKVEAVEQIESILHEVDGVSIARGDLGLEVGIENLPYVQADLIRACRERGRMVQVGGEVMHSTIRSPRPLRSEVADIALLVAQGVDGISLSAETAVGHDPVGAVRMLDRVVRRAERALDEARPAPLVPYDAGSDVADALGVSAARAASPILVSAPADEVNWLNCSWGMAPQPHRRRVITTMAKAWEGILDYPLKNRTAKPRTAGTTFLSLKGVGLAGTRDLIQVAGDYIDRAKLAFGTTLLLEEDFLREQIRLFREADIEVNPGGTSGEIALHQDRYPQYLARARELGFTTIEVSDGTVEMDDATRERLIKSSLDAGFKVVSEVGKKDPELTLPIAESIRQIQRDLRYGAAYVTIESRASAKGVGVFDADGKVKVDDVEAIANAVDPHRLIWEAPTTEGQLFFIRRFGPNVNLGNIAPTDIIPLEGQRRGLRGDTFRMVAYQPDQLEAMLNAEHALFAH